MGAFPRKKTTDRQELLGHLLDHHNPPLASVSRWTLAYMERWHEAQHREAQGHAHEPAEVSAHG